MNKKLPVIVCLILIAVLGFVAWNNVRLSSQKLQLTGFAIPSDWKEYRNTELRISFLYPPEFGSVVQEWDTHAGISGSELNGVIAPVSDPNNPQFIFGASSPDYSENGVEPRSSNFSDQIQTMESFASNEFYKVVPIESNGVPGKLLIGTGKCDGVGCLPSFTNDPLHPAYLAVFSLPENTRGLKVVGLEAFSESKDEFLKILSTFKQI